MSVWTDGYVEGIEYARAYQRELNPLRVAMAFVNANLVAPAIVTACELGFGQGLSVNLHAAASATQWFGTDFNSAQAGFARELAAASGAEARLFDQSFAEFCSRGDLPDFDFIGLHGVWSWISDENRAILVDFLRRKLKAGGVVYIGYNALPGHIAMAPIQDVLSRHAESRALAPAQGTANRIDEALAFAERLLAVSPLYAHANPQLAERLKMIRGKNQAYLAHEYFNRSWMPVSFARMADWLAPAKLEYACSANYFDMVDAWNLTPEQQTLLGEISDTTLRETVRDIMLNRTFRWDYWVRGARRLTPLQRSEALLSQRVMLIRQRTDVTLKVRGARGEFTLLQSICDPVLDALADHRPKTLEQIAQALNDKRVGIPQLADIVLTLVTTGAVAPVQDEAVIRAAKLRTDPLNAMLCDKARSHPDISYLASPVIGGGFREVGGRVALFFLHGMSQGRRHPAELAEHVSRIFYAQGVTILRDGRPMDSTAEGLGALTAQAAYFLDKQLAVLQALQIAGPPES
jgi:hypothetical protein